MDNQLLIIKAKCKENERCLFAGEDVFINIEVTNSQKTEIGFPLEYVREKGPIVKLIDTRTKAETNIPTHIADWDLKEKFVLLKSGESAALEWVVTADELRQFGDRVDLSAEITVMAQIKANGKIVDFRGADTLRIVSKDEHEPVPEKQSS